MDHDDAGRCLDAAAVEQGRDQATVRGNPDADARPFNAPGLTHLSFAVDDLAGTVARVPDLGGEVVTDFPGTAAIIRDPGGQLIELLPMSYRDTLA